MRAYDMAKLGDINIVLVIILGLVILGGFAGLLKAIFTLTEKAPDPAACRTSIEAHLRFGTDINCPADTREIKETDETEMKRALADKLVNCWDTFGQGKQKLFSEGDEKFCVVCAVTSFKKKDVTLDKFSVFLATESFTHPLMGRQRYLDFLTGTSTDNTIVDLAKGTMPDFIDTNRQYAVLFTFFKKSYWSQLQGTIYGGGAGAGLAAVGIVVVAALGGPIAVPALIVLAGTAAGAATGASVTGEGTGASFATGGADWDPGIILVPYDNSTLKSLGCTNLPVGLGFRENI